MNRKIDFVVMGVPRSGTTALVHVLNLHPEVFCGMEFLSGADEHKNIRYPEAFEAINSLTDNQRKMLTRLVQSKPAPLVIGNKQPRYYLDLPGLLRQVPDVKLIWLYRSPLQFMSSWNRRAGNANDPHWHRGQTGIFGAMELMICLEALLQVRQSVLVVPYQYFFFENVTALARLFKFLSLSQDADVEARFSRELFGRSAILEKERCISDTDNEVIGVMEEGYLERVIGNREPFLFSDKRDEISDYLSHTKINAKELFFRLSREFSPDENDYLVSWRQFSKVKQFLKEPSLIDRLAETLNRNR